MSSQRPESLRRKNIWFEQSEWEELKHHALERGLSPSELVGEILNEYLSDTPVTWGVTPSAHTHSQRQQWTKTN